MTWLAANSKVTLVWQLWTKHGPDGVETTNVREDTQKSQRYKDKSAKQTLEKLARKKA